MIITEEQLLDVEAALDFDPVSARRALTDRTPLSASEPIRVQRRLAQALGEGADAAELAVERIITGGDSLNSSYLERGALAARAVARLTRTDERGRIEQGTGFLASSRLLVAHHALLPSAADAVACSVGFGHAHDVRGVLGEPVLVDAVPDELFVTSAALGVTVVALAPTSRDGLVATASLGWLPLPESPDTALRGEWLTVVHHPGGLPRQVSIRQNLLIRAGTERIWYHGETAPASAGAAVFNDSWQVVAVHRGGAPARDGRGRIVTTDGTPWHAALDESRIVWRAGTGTRASAIVALLREHCGTHPLVLELLRGAATDASDAVAPGAVEQQPAAAKPGTAATASDGALRANGHAAPTPANVGRNGAEPGSPGAAPGASVTVTVPLRITVHAGATPAHGRGPAIGVDLS